MAMQNSDLLISSLLEHAALNYPEREIVTRPVEGGPLHYTNYRNIAKRAKQGALSLVHDLKINKGDVVGTLAWNTYRHLEIYYAISGLGAILHTLNPRLFPEQLTYILNHAEDKILFTDITFVPLIDQIFPTLKSLEFIVVLTSKDHMPDLKSLHNIPKFRIICYETLIHKYENQSLTFTWPSFPETTPSSLCYTSGTTGNPKGVLYNHRSTLIHTFAMVAPDVLGVSANDSILVIVPMFHANAWGIPYAATMTGCKLVLPGRAMDGESIYELLVKEKVTITGAVPSVWILLFSYLDSAKKKNIDLPKLTDLKKVLCGGSAVPRALIDRVHKEFGAVMCQAWGMTETSPLGTVCALLPQHQNLPWDEELKIRVKQGRQSFGVELKLVNDDGKEVTERDGKTYGNLQIRGPWVVKQYFKENKDAVDANNWFTTGDVAVIDSEGFMQITDRAKDVIKSGGEWISSLDLENVVMNIEEVQECAVIGVKHVKWEERPLLLIVLKPGCTTTKEQVWKFLEDKVAKWWVPDDVLFVQELPHTGTGKIEKRKLRDFYQDHEWPTRSVTNSNSKL